MPIDAYVPRTAFSGVVDRPNVLFMVVGNTGFGHLGCYGAPIRTPNLDRLAAHGLLFTNMHATALLSPSRSCSSISRVLLERAYNTFAIGKWQLVPAEHTGAAGPFDRWPLGRGFERFYGFLGGDTHQYHPDLVCDNHRIRMPRTPEQGYHLTEDLVDQAIVMISDAKQVAPTKPFFMYFSTGAMHPPHHVPRAWADQYRGAFDEGWDIYRERALQQQKRKNLVPQSTRLSARDPDVAAWNDLSAGERRLYARTMEVFAGFLEHTDHQIGRLLAFLDRSGQLANTLVMFISDNGADGGHHGAVNEPRYFNNMPATVEDGLAAIDELGGPKHFNCYPWGWAWAGNTPFGRWTRERARGISEPFIAHWPHGITTAGRPCTRLAHFADIVPTVLDALRIEAPAGDGVSFANVFREPSDLAASLESCARCAMQSTDQVPASAAIF